MKKKLFALLLCVLCLICFAACGANDPAAPEETEAPQVAVVQPLPASVDPAALTDCMVAASFTPEDINRDDPAAPTLSMRVFDPIYYDAVELSLLEAGGQIEDSTGAVITVESIEVVDGLTEINGGMDQGCITLMPGDGGIYEQITFDDHNVYRELGTALLPISADCVFTDDSDLEQPGQTYTLEELITLLATENDPGCNQLNTTVTVESGIVTAINRVYIP